MRSIIAIRTNKWTAEEERLLAALQPVFGQDIAVVFHDRPADVAPPVDVIDLNADWVKGNGLAILPDWGWRCGDYSHYALRAARPGYDYYWLVEPDVFFTSSPEGFFAAFAAAREDALGYRLGRFDKENRFTRGLPGMAHYRAIFALTRFSAKAVDHLFAQRAKMALNPISTTNYPNDEIFCFSHLAAEADLSWGRLEDYAPDWFHEVRFDVDPDLLFDQVVAATPPGRVLHPVRQRAIYKQALGRRLTANTGILMNIREALDMFDASDVEDVATEAANQVRRAITDLQARRALRRKRQEARRK
ncbi:MAG: component of SufBCD complex [Albidovulum sp.]